VFCFLLTLGVKAQIGIVDRNAKKKPTLVVLGTYHMSATTTNVVNNQVDDITSPERQKQVVELVERLKKFKPTKIAVECDIEDDAKVHESYNQYLSGNRQLSKNETNQIGFRLAKDLGHKKVYCVDWGIFPADQLYWYEKYAAKDAELNDFVKKVHEDLKKDADAETQKLRTFSVSDQLIFLNQPELSEKSHQRYFEIMRIGRGAEYVGANYLSWWYGRNMKILNNIIRITDSMDDQILVVYGSGHNKLLNQFARESEFYTVESPLKYLKRKK
ncbi:MAG TPA: DUF5694 domain-containing protein, partial [Pyrinomonadaceae bacterium]|nr:DUF5694 domain-containing protein [Pyrinomonadaceae bacterium]